MQDIKQKVVAEIANRLRAIGASFYINSDGFIQESGDLIVSTPSKFTKVYAVPRGTAAKLWKPKVDALKSGEVLSFTRDEIAAIGMDEKHFFKTLNTALQARFGTGNYSSMRDEESGAITAIAFFDKSESLQGEIL